MGIVSYPALTLALLLFFPVVLGLLALPHVSPGKIAVTFILAFGLAYYLCFPRVDDKVLARFMSASQLRDGTMGPIAHRGGGGEAPENTLAAIRLSRKNGATAVEIDIEFTSDWVPVLVHDETVDRTTDGTGIVHQMPWSRLQTLNAGAKFISPDGSGGDVRERVPTLEEAVEACLDLGYNIYFDVKAYPIMSGRTLRDLYRKYPALYHTSAVCSFDPLVVYVMRWYDPKVLTGLTSRTWNFAYEYDPVTKKYRDRPELSTLRFIWYYIYDVLLDLGLELWIWRACGNSLFLLQKDEIDKGVIKKWDERGVKLATWTVNTQAEKDKFSSLGVPYITDWLVKPLN